MVLLSCSRLSILSLFIGIETLSRNFQVFGCGENEICNTLYSSYSKDVPRTHKTVQHNFSSKNSLVKSGTNGEVFPETKIWRDERIIKGKPIGLNDDYVMFEFPYPKGFNRLIPHKVVLRTIFMETLEKSESQKAIWYTIDKSAFDVSHVDGFFLVRLNKIMVEILDKDPFFLFVYTGFRHQFTKRSTTVSTQNHLCSNLTTTCCLDFKTLRLADIGWNFIIYPITIEFPFCRGTCDPTITPLSLFNTRSGLILYKMIKHGMDIDSPACYPTDLRSLDVIFHGEDDQINRMEIPQFLPSSCQCG